MHLWHGVGWLTFCCSGRLRRPLSANVEAHGNQPRQRTSWHHCQCVGLGCYRNRPNWGDVLWVRILRRLLVAQGGLPSLVGCRSHRGGCCSELSVADPDAQGHVLLNSCHRLSPSRGCGSALLSSSSRIAAPIRRPLFGVIGVWSVPLSFNWSLQRTPSAPADFQR